jgi:hypothetical protein
MLHAHAFAVLGCFDALFAFGSGDASARRREDARMEAGIFEVPGVPIRRKLAKCDWALLV